MFYIKTRLQVKSTQVKTSTMPVSSTDTLSSRSAITDGEWKWKLGVGGGGGVGAEGNLFFLFF